LAARDLQPAILYIIYEEMNPADGK